MKKILTIFFTILVLTACTEVTKHESTKDEVTDYSYNFFGESEHWEAVYSYEGRETWGNKDGKITYSNEDSHDFVLNYKGTLKELSSMKKLEYSYETISSGGNSTMEFTEPPTTVTFRSRGSSSGGAKVSEDEVIQVHVKWDEFEESFELHNKNK